MCKISRESSPFSANSFLFSDINITKSTQTGNAFEARYAAFVAVYYFVTAECVGKKR